MREIGFSGRLELIKRKRRRVRVLRPHLAEYLGPNYVRVTCTDCSLASEGEPINGYEMSEIETRKVVKRWNGGNRKKGITLACKRCTQRARDSAYPLPSINTK